MNAPLHFVARGVLATLLITVPASAQSEAEIAATHDALRALKAGVEEAFNTACASGDDEDFEKMLAFLDEDVVLTAINGDCIVGREAMIEYHQRKLQGPDATVTSIRHIFDVDELSMLYGDDTAVAYGSTTGEYVLTDGTEFDVDSRWTCTMVKKDDRWLVASFQFGINIFDNAMLDQAVRAMWWAAAIAAVVGLVVGLILRRGAKR